ncbi:fluoride efflux transporter FluC [Brevibacterium litoralis]|uniref:fluoride efflux transporter FluC n=1 Tax=Brevibacterium litoralis TaxID=3138935 RepID=UPI0032EB2224
MSDDEAPSSPATDSGSGPTGSGPSSRRPRIRRSVPNPSAVPWYLAVPTVFLGGAVGTWGRVSLMDALPGPFATVEVGVHFANAGGTFLLAVLLSALVYVPGKRATLARLFLGTGLAGALTTASALGLGLSQAQGADRWAGMGLALAIGIVGAGLGWFLGRFLRGKYRNPPAGEVFSATGVDTDTGLGPVVVPDPDSELGIAAAEEATAGEAEEATAGEPSDRPVQAAEAKNDAEARTAAPRTEGEPTQAMPVVPAEPATKDDSTSKEDEK